ALDAAGDEVHGGEVAHLPRAEDENPLPLERPEDPLRELGRGGGDRRGVLTDRRPRTHPPPDTEGLPEDAVDDRPGSPRLLGRLVGAANLAEDLGLAR